jgi:hypothetical protein
MTTEIISKIKILQSQNGRIGKRVKEVRKRV